MPTKQLSRDIGTLKQFIHATRSALSTSRTRPTRPEDSAVAEAAEHLVRFILSRETEAEGEAESRGEGRYR